MKAAVERCELAIVGAGPAGLAAAHAAAMAGAEVVVLDGYARPGGQYFRQRPETFQGTVDPGHDSEARAAFARLANLPIRVLGSTVVWGVVCLWRRCRPRF